MDKFFLDPAPADPSVIICGVLCHFLCDFSKFQPEKCRCILRTSHRSQFQGHISHLMVAEIQTQPVPSGKRMTGKVFHRICLFHFRIYTIRLHNIHNCNRFYHCFIKLWRTGFCFFHKFFVGHTDHIQVDTYFWHSAALLSSSSLIICG